MRAVLVILPLILFARCGSNACADVRGTCVSLLVRGNNAAGARMTVNRFIVSAAGMTQTISSSRTYTLPVAVGISFSTPQSFLQIDVVASLDGATVGGGSTSVTVVNGRTVDAEVVLSPSTAVPLQ